MVRYQHHASFDDLQTAIHLLRGAAEGSQSTSERADRLGDLTTAHIELYNRTAAPEALESAIGYGEQSIALMAPNSPDPLVLCAMGIAHKLRFELNGALADADTSIRYHRQTIGTASRGPSDYAMFLSNLGIAYQSRFQRTGEPADIDAGIEYCARAVEYTPAGNPRLLAHTSHLAAGYLLRSEQTGSQHDLQSAIDHGEDALAASGTDHPDRGQLLTNLGVAYRSRYLISEDSADLERGIELARQALSATPEPGPRRAGRLLNLSASFALRFLKTRDTADLKCAIDFGEQALSAYPPGHAGSGAVLTDLCAYYVKLYGFSLDQQRTDLDKAVEYGKRATAAIPAPDTRRSRALSELGAAYGARFEQFREPADADAAAACCTQALAALPPGDPQRAGHLTELATVYRTWLDHGHRSVGPDVLAHLAEHSADLSAAPPRARVNAARAVAAVFMRAGRTTVAAGMLRTAIEALGNVASRELTQQDRVHGMREQEGLVGQAITAHVDIGAASTAVELAELGRGIVLSNELDARRGLSRLADSAPALAAEFDELRGALNAEDPVDAPGGASASGFAEPRSRRALASRWDELIARIRSHPGFADFLRPPSLDMLQEAAKDGAVVLVSVSSARGDAIIVRADGVTAIPLRHIWWDYVLKYRQKLFDAVDPRFRMTSMERRKAISDVLQWLWLGVTRPVLDELEYHDRQGEWPRLWWVPVGPMSQLPLHAAGLPGGPSALDRVVSSYAPTIRSLLGSRGRAVAAERRQLTVAVPTVAGQPPLPRTAAEALDRHVTPPQARVLRDNEATVTEALAAMRDATWVHFACHTVTDHANPLNSCLLLSDGPLSVAQISRQRLDNADLAYLSACATGQAGSRHLDEAIHLGTAFQVAGYRHVIATLWQVGDTTAAEAARAFYRSLPGPAVIDQAARALHQTVRQLRDELPNRPDLWAPFVHIGP